MTTQFGWPDRAASRFGLRPSRLAARSITYTTTGDISLPGSPVQIMSEASNGVGSPLDCVIVWTDIGLGATIDASI